MQTKRYERGQLTAAILQAVAVTPGRTATELAHIVEHTPAWVSGILARLTRQGRVSRAHDFGRERSLRGRCPWVYSPGAARN